jgi:hypothetical protein
VKTPRQVVLRLAGPNTSAQQRLALADRCRAVEVVRGALEALPPRADRSADLAASRALCRVLERLSEEVDDAGAMEAEVRGVEAAANDAERRADELEAALARVCLEDGDEGAVVLCFG